MSNPFSTFRAAVPLLCVLAVTAGCTVVDRDLRDALELLTPEEMVRHVQVLASDEFEGRAPSSPGEEKTITYLREQFAALGLEPGNHGSWFQEVPLVGITADPRTTLSFRSTAGTRTLTADDEMVIWTKRVVERSAIRDSEMVFVGYGIVAPEYGWNDYAGLDVRGRTVVILVNDPGYATGEEDLFTGRAMTYYGRWTYKFAEAARQGASGALIVHETGPAGYGWDVVRGSWTGTQFDLVAPDENRSQAAIEGWISQGGTEHLFELSGETFEELKSRAARRGFRGVPLNVRATAEVRNTLERSVSHNVLARLPGSVRPDEHIIFTAHWDHLGRDDTLEGDGIYNGARDNATGTSALIQMARAYASLPNRPDRSLLFLVVTAEEQGLLGSAFYADNPIYPLETTVATINLDGLNIWGPMHDITVIGYGQSELDDYLREVAAAHGRQIRPDPEPEKGYYYRSDHFSFAKVGVPALYTNVGIQSVEHGEGWAQAQQQEWTRLHYHQPSDRYQEWWDLRGAIDDVKLLFSVGYRLAHETGFPQWSPTSEFRGVREAMLRP